MIEWDFEGLLIGNIMIMGVEWWSYFYDLFGALDTVKYICLLMAVGEEQHIVYILL